MAGYPPEIPFNEELTEFPSDYAEDILPPIAAPPGLLGYCPGDQFKPRWKPKQGLHGLDMPCEPPPPGTEEPSWPIGTETISPSSSVISSKSHGDVWSAHGPVRPLDNNNQSAQFNFQPECFYNQSEPYIDQSESYIDQSGSFQEPFHPVNNQSGMFDYQADPCFDQSEPVFTNEAWHFNTQPAMTGYNPAKTKPSRSGNIRHIYYPSTTCSSTQSSSSSTTVTSAPLESTKQSEDSKAITSSSDSIKAPIVCSTSVASTSAASTSSVTYRPTVTSSRTTCCSAAADGSASIVCCLRCVANIYGRCRDWRPPPKSTDDIVLITKASEVAKLTFSNGSRTSVSSPKVSTVTTALQDKLTVSSIPLPSIQSEVNRSLSAVSTTPSITQARSSITKPKLKMRNGHKPVKATSHDKPSDKVKFKMVPESISGSNASIKSKANIDFKTNFSVDTSSKSKPSIDSKSSLNSHAILKSKASIDSEPSISSDASLNSTAIIKAKRTSKSKATTDFNTSPHSKVSYEPKVGFNSETSLDSNVSFKYKTSLESDVSPDSTLKAGSTVSINSKVENATESTDNTNNNARLSKHQDTHGTATSLAMTSIENTHSANEKKELKQTGKRKHQKERYLINELLAEEPEQSPSTTFQLLIWEIYYNYFAERPVLEMSHFLMVQLYRILTHQLSISSHFICKLCKVKEQYSFVDYVTHTQSMTHAQCLTRHIDKKDEYGYQALKRAVGSRSWFCDICPDVDWEVQNPKCYGISQHCSTSVEHQRRLKCIQEFIKDAKSLQDVQRIIAPIPAKVKVAEKKFDAMVRFQVEAKILNTSTSRKFLCSMDSCKNCKYNPDLDGYIRHCESLGHMMNLYTKLETFGPKNLFLEFGDPFYGHFESQDLIVKEAKVKFTGYYTKTKKHFCGICPIRRPADHFDPGSFQTHISSTEHTRNVQVIKQLYDRSVRGCIYMCAKDCIINHELLSQKPLSHPAVSLASSRSISETSKSSIASQVSKSSKTDQTGSSDAVSGQIKATAPRRLSLNSVQGIFQSVKSAMVYNDSNNTLAPSTVKATSQLVSQSSAGKITSSNVESKIIAQSVDNAKNTHVEDAKKSSLLSSALTSSTHCEKKSQKTKERKPLSEKKRKDVANTAESDEAAKKSSKCSPREKTLSPSDSDRRTTSSSSARYSQTSHRSVYGQPYRSYKYDSSTSFRHRNYKNSFQQNRKSYSRRDSSSRRSNSRSRKRSYRSRSRSSSSERISKSKHQRSKESSKRHRYRSISKSGDSRDSSQERASHKKARTRVKAGHHYSYKSPGNSKRRRSRRSRSETSSSSSDRTQHSSRSSRSSKIRSRRSKSFASSSDSSSTESTCSSSTISRRRQCSSSRSLSTCSPRGQRRGKRSRSPSKSSPLASKRVDVHRQFRYISPPPFPLGNSSIYCINPDFEKLNVRSLSPVSADVVSRTVENAWKFYHSRYYSQSELSTDIVYDAQVLFLKSYSGFFMQAPNFENCYNSLYKPEDLKAALRMRLDRLSPGPAKDPNVTISKRESPEYQNNMVTSSQPALKSDAAHQHSNNIPNTAESMKTLIKTGAVPGLSLMDDSETCAYNMSASSTVSADPANDGIRNAIESLRQSYSGASAKEETFDHGDLDSLTLAERKTSESFIPFLNDGTLDEVRNLPDNQESKKISNSDMELPWHYKQHSASRSPEDICETVLSKEDAYTTNNLSTNMLSMNNNHQNACKKYSQNVISEQKQEVDKKEKSKKEEDKLQSVGGVVMSAFIADVVKGIIRLSTLQTDTELSPTEMLNEMEHEQEKMHSRMITPAGHYMINMAKRILSPESGQSLQLEFDKADPEAVELMKTLDVRVVELIASTPFLSE